MAEETREYLRQRYAEAIRNSGPGPTVQGAAAAVLAVRDEEMERVQEERDQAKAAVARVDALHQRQVSTGYKPCRLHSDTRNPDLIPMADCPGCTPRQEVACSNWECYGWPCANHLAIHGETREACTHAGR